MPASLPFLKPPGVRWLFWCCVGAVLYLALASSPGVAFSGSDKTNHVLAFLVLQVLGILSWSTRPRLVATGLVAYGVLIELLQSLTGYRAADWRDVVADLLGILLALAAAEALRRFRKLRG